MINSQNILICPDAVDVFNSLPPVRIVPSRARGGNSQIDALQGMVMWYLLK